MAAPLKSEDEFYDLSSPADLQQGDIFPDAPLISIPPSEHLVIIRDSQTQVRLASPAESQQVKLMHEQAVDSFSEGEPEHVMVSARRGPAMLITQTCDLVDHDYWLVCPMYSLEGSEVRENELFSEDDWKNHYPTLFGLPAHPGGYFDKQYVDLADMHSVYSGGIELSKRVASLTPLKQARLGDKIVRMFARAWGYNAGDDVPRDGKYRCNMCSRFFGIDIAEKEFKAGTKFPQCANCDRIGKRPQWVLLQKHRRF